MTNFFNDADFDCRISTSKMLTIFGRFLNNYLMLQSKGKASQTEQKKVKQIKAMQSNAKPSNVKQSNTKQSKTKQRKSM